MRAVGFASSGSLRTRHKMLCCLVVLKTNALLKIEKKKSTGSAATASTTLASARLALCVVCGDYRVA